jgi:hypothetical protein
VRLSLRLPVALVGFTLAVVVAGCSSGRSAADPEPPPSPTVTAAAEPLDVIGHPPEDRWEVAVATVDPEIETVSLHRSRPRAAALTRVAGRTPAPPGPATVAPLPGPLEALDPSVAHADAGALSPIPSPGLSWGSTEADDGWVFQNPTLIGSPLAFLVVDERDDWLRVMLPARPNQQTAWVARDDVEVAHHRWRAEVDLTTNRLRVWDDHELKIDSAVVSGTEFAPTPRGRFYLNEKQPNDPGGPYGSWILSTNGFSDTLERFSGEVPIFALHGTPYPETMGQRLSNGCIRLPNPVVEYLAAEMPVGTPIDVVG